MFSAISVTLLLEAFINLVVRDIVGENINKKIIQSTTWVSKAQWGFSRCRYRVFVKVMYASDI